MLKIVSSYISKLIGLAKILPGRNMNYSRLNTTPKTTFCLIEKWAKCHRHFPHGDTDTNMYLER